MCDKENSINHYGSDPSGSLWVAIVNGVILSSTDGTTWNPSATTFTGPAGATGPAGPTGATGATGPASIPAITNSITYNNTNASYLMSSISNPYNTWDPNTSTRCFTIGEPNKINIYLISMQITFASSSWIPSGDPYTWIYSAYLSYDASGQTHVGYIVINDENNTKYNSRYAQYNILYKSFTVYTTTQKTLYLNFCGQTQTSHFSNLDITYTFNPNNDDYINVSCIGTTTP